MTSVTRLPSDAVDPTRLFRDYALLVAAIAKSANFNAIAARDVVICTVALPDGKRVSGQAANSELATKQLLISLTDAILAEHDGTHWQPAYEAALAAGSLNTEEEVMDTCTNDESPSHTKARQVTIGVSTKKSFHSAISALADSRGESVSEVARELVSVGFEEFEERSYVESESTLLKSFESRLETYAEGEPSQWMLRLDPRLATRIKLSAKEYGRSASQMAAMCMSQALSELSTGHVASASSRLEVARATITAIRGPAARRMAEEVGLGARGPLLSSILSGRVIAPRAVLRALSSKLKIPMAMLADLFKESFLAMPVPAFKAEDGKPQVCLEQQSWEDAVRSLKLPETDTTALLRYSD